LAFLWAINATQADRFGAVVVQDFEGVAVEDGDNGAGEVDSEQRACSEYAAKDYDEVGMQKRLAIGRRLYHPQESNMTMHGWPT
jgi:hypothetical protein